MRKWIAALAVALSGLGTVTAVEKPQTAEATWCNPYLAPRMVYEVCGYAPWEHHQHRAVGSLNTGGAFHGPWVGSQQQSLIVMPTSLWNAGVRFVKVTVEFR